MDALVKTRWSSTMPQYRFAVRNPAYGTTITDVMGSGPDEVAAAVNVAAEAQVRWARRPPAERAHYLRMAAGVVRAHAEELAELESEEMGKPISQALGYDLQAAIAIFEYFAGALPILGGGIRDAGSLLDIVERHPFGVVAAVIPFNWPPIHMAGKSAPALAMGNAMLIKPGEQAPLTVIRMVELISEILPDEVLHVVPGGGATGAALTANPLIRKVSFTGAPTTGAIVARSAAENLVPTVMELGGKNPLIVFADADLKAAARWIVEGAFFNQGEACTAVSRAIVHRSVIEEITERVAAATRRLVVGDGSEATTHVGPLVTRAQQEKVLEYIRIGRAEGARVVAEADLPQDSRLADGYFVAPTVFAGVEPGMRLEQEEIFGPVLSIISFDEESEAVEIANDTAFGLVAGVFTADQERGVRISRQLDAGIVFVNNYNRGLVGLPFGGIKHSGYGREHTLETLYEWSYTKTLRLPSGSGDIPFWNGVTDVFGDTELEAGAEA